jgi:uncharacterized membrane protein (DUF485 family)
MSERRAKPGGKNRVGFLLSTLVTGLFFALVLVMAFRPAWLSPTVSAEGVVSPGLTLAFAFLLSTLGAMSGFSWWRGTHRDD